MPITLLSAPFSVPFPATAHRIPLGTNQKHFYRRARCGMLAMWRQEATGSDRQTPGARQSAVQVSSYQRTVNVPPARVGVRVGATRTVLAVAA